MSSEIKIATGIFICICLGIWAASAKTDQNYSSVPSLAKNNFDYYILSTQWIPGWCVVGNEGSGAILDLMDACQKQNGRPLMYHGLWPEFNNGNYPINCYNVQRIDKEKLKFQNPYTGYLANSDAYIDHEWAKHGTCSSFYTPGKDKIAPQRYYEQINNYFSKSIALANQIKLTVFPLEIDVADLKKQIHRLNPRIPASSILVMCKSDQYKQNYLTGLWFCLDKPYDRYIPCPKEALKTSCSGLVVTR